MLGRSAMRNILFIFHNDILFRLLEYGFDKSRQQSGAQPAMRTIAVIALLKQTTAIARKPRAVASVAHYLLRSRFLQATEIIDKCHE